VCSGGKKGSKAANKLKALNTWHEGLYRCLTSLHALPHMRTLLPARPGKEDGKNCCCSRPASERKEIDTRKTKQTGCPHRHHTAGTAGKEKGAPLASGAAPQPRATCGLPPPPAGCASCPSPAHAAGCPGPLRASGTKPRPPAACELPQPCMSARPGAPRTAPPPQAQSSAGCGSPNAERSNVKVRLHAESASRATPTSASAFS